MENLDELKHRFKKFSKKSHEKFNDLYKQIKDDRAFIGGNQWNKDDEALLGKKRAFGNTINFLANGVRSIRNTYSTNPFKWSYNDNNLTTAANKFLSDVDNSTALCEALTNSISTGLGILVESIIVENNIQKPILYSIADVTTVLLDPDSTKLNGSDMSEAAIIELKSKRWLKANYGEEFICELSHDGTYEFDIANEYDRKGYMPLITYFVKEDNGVTVYKMLGSNLVEEPLTLALSHLPIVPVYGEQIWNDEEITYCGIVNQGKAIQKTLNYAYRQLQERLAKTPCNTWVSGTEAIEGFEEYYKNSDKSLNPLLLFKQYSADKKIKFDAPTRLSNSVEFADVMGIIKESLSIMQTIVGIDAIGIQDEVARTATEVVSSQKTFINNIRHYLNNLKESFKVLGEIFAELFGYNEIEITVEEGPEKEMQRQVARAEIGALLPMLTDENEKKLALHSMLSTFTDNQYILQLAQGLQQMNIPTAGEMQGQQLLAQADQEIKNRDAQIIELQKQLQEMKQSSDLQAYSLQREMMLNEQKHNYEMEKLAFEKQLDTNPAEVEQEALKVKQEEIKTQNEAIKLQKEINGGLDA